MIEVIYLERRVRAYPRVQAILARFPMASLIEIEHYGEVFNVHQQDFRIQKTKPALILAEKQNRKVLATPSGFGIGAEHNYYFSHLLNCIYDCRYCFLQGMYRSANYVLFVNYEDFAEEIRATMQRHRGAPVYFFSGYDSDSLALESVTGFLPYFLHIFESLPNAYLELRTKSVSIRSLLSRPALRNVIVAFSLSPPIFAKRFDEKAPPVQARLKAIKALGEAGWLLGLRFDPLLYAQDWRNQYDALFESIDRLGINDQIHSVSTGPLRFPKKMHKRIADLYPESELFAAPLEQRDGVTAYPDAIEREMKTFAEERLERQLGKHRLFHCQSEGGTLS